VKATGNVAASTTARPSISTRERRNAWGGNCDAVATETAPGIASTRLRRPAKNGSIRSGVYFSHGRVSRMVRIESGSKPLSTR
jgi:hypothetical protein